MLALLGGTSWPSTPIYYEKLNRLAERDLGSGHSADLWLKSVDYYPVRSRYATDWPYVRSFLKSQLDELAKLDPEAIIICNNTLHKAYDELEEIHGENLGYDCQIVHVVDSVANVAKQKSISSLLLLAVEFTLKDGFYAKRLEANGIEVVLPDEAEIKQVQKIQTLVSQGHIEPSFFDFFSKLINSYSHLDGVALACTEIPLVVDENLINIPAISSIDAQVEMAWDLENI